MPNEVEHCLAATRRPPSRPMPFHRPGEPAARFKMLFADE